MSILSNLYFHIDMDLNDNDKYESKIFLEEVLRDYSSKIFRQEVEIFVEIHDGSIKAKLYVIGALYIAIGQYGSFRAGVDQLIDDSKLLQKLVLSELYKEGVAEEFIIEKKRPMATPDKIRRLLLRIDRFENKDIYLDKIQKGKELENIKKYIANLANEIGNKEDLELLISQISKKYLPEPINLPKYNRNNMPYIQEEEHALFTSRKKLKPDRKSNNTTYPALTNSSSGTDNP